MIYLTGDVHASLDYNKLLNFRDKMKGKLSKNDYLIILGDFGLIWYPNPKHPERIKAEKLLDKLDRCPWTTLFIDGNHENHDMLEELPRQEKFGGVIGKVRDSIFHLRRGQFYKIEEKLFYTFGGGLSIDKDYRVPGVSYWEKELPTTQEMNQALDLISCMENNHVDYILTHEAPKRYVNQILGMSKDEPRPAKFNSPLAQMFDSLHDMLNFKMWFCGHYHEDNRIDKLQALYRNIVNLQDFV